MKKINDKSLERFCTYLKNEEKSPRTVEKYRRDVRAFLAFVGKRKITKELVIEFKNYLKENYKLTSANSMIAAMNSFFKWVGAYQLTVKSFKIQKSDFRSSDRDLTVEEYKQLAEEAKRRKQIWLYLVIVTLCSTGIRIGELLFITVEALSTRRAKVINKGKIRWVILTPELCEKLMEYAQQRGVTRKYLHYPNWKTS